MNKSESVVRMSSGLNTLHLAVEDAPKAIYLHPGQSFASATPSLISTIVGSCVAVLLWDGHLRIGGAAHYLLPKSEKHDIRSARYGDIAIEELLHRMRELGCREHHLTAKLFGGAAVLGAFQNNRSHHLGTRNVEFAVQLLQEKAIPILEKEVGGTRGRKVLFKTQEGLTLVTEI